jgi:hypothetical protein
MPKNLNHKEIEDVPVVDDALLDTAVELVELPVVLAAPVPVAGPVPGKRALGVKEPIIFKWKLIGTSHNMTLTLFKAVEREDVDAQFERTQREGYYTDLKILDADAKVEQPVQPKGTKKPSPRTERGGKAAVPTAIRTDVAKRSSPPQASPPRKPTPAKSALKTKVKTTKKKPSGSAGASKRAAKKK